MTSDELRLRNDIEKLAEYSRKLERELSEAKQELEAARNEIGRLTSCGTGVEGISAE